MGIGGRSLGLYTEKLSFGGGNRFVHRGLPRARGGISGMALGLYTEKLPFGGGNRCVHFRLLADIGCYRCLESIKIINNNDWTPIEVSGPEE